MCFYGEWMFAYTAESLWLFAQLFTESSWNVRLAPVSTSRLWSLTPINLLQNLCNWPASKMKVYPKSLQLILTFVSSTVQHLYTWTSREKKRKEINATIPGLADYSELHFSIFLQLPCKVLNHATLKALFLSPSTPTSDVSSHCIAKRSFVASYQSFGLTGKWFSFKSIVKMWFRF